MARPRTLRALKELVLGLNIRPIRNNADDDDDDD
jgi:hypothetical protein